MAEENTQIRRPVLRDYSPADPNPLQIDIGQSFVNQSSVDPVVEQQPIAYSQSHGGSNNTEKKSYPPFYPFLKKTGAGHEIAVRTGYVVEHVIVGDDSIKYHLPTNVPAGDSEDPDWLAITPGQYLYVKVEVAIDGTITGTPVLMVGASGLKGEHYRPKVFDFGGNAGTVYYKLCKLESSGTGVKIVRYNAGSNIQHYDERVTMENEAGEGGGDYYDIGKTYDDGTDTVKIRQLKQLDGDGEVVIKGYDEPDQEAINFRRIKQRYDPQIHVTGEDNAIKIHGNDANGGLYHIPCGETTGVPLIEWTDGLITTNREVSFEAGCSGSSRSGGGIP